MVLSYVPVACAWQCSSVPAPFPAPVDMSDLAYLDDVLNPVLDLLDELISSLTSTVLELFPELQNLYFPDDLGPISDVIDRLSYLLFLLALYLAGTIPFSDVLTPYSP